MPAALFILHLKDFIQYDVKCYIYVNENNIKIEKLGVLLAWLDVKGCVTHLYSSVPVRKREKKEVTELIL